MGWCPNDNIRIKRNYDTRTINVSWHDAVLGEQQKDFSFEAEQNVCEFVASLIKERCM